MFGLRQFKYPFGKMIGPFAVASAVIMYEIHGLQKALCHTEKFANDPQNPYYTEIQAKKHAATH